MLLVLTALFLAALPLAAAGPTGQIAYNTAYNTIYVINPDGSGRKELGPGRRPAWSPDGERIVFVGGGGISVMNRDGTGVELLLDGPNPSSDPSFSPDGQQILFTRFPSGDQESFIYVMDAVPGAQPRQISLFPSNPEDPSMHYQPSWADGRSIAFILARPSQYGTRNLGDLYLADLEGAHIRLLSGGVGHNQHPAWSPDGRTIAFYSRRQDGEGIYLVDVDGTALQLLSPPWNIDWSPSWSPDGEWIAFASSQSRKSIDVLIMRPDGTDVTNLTGDSLAAEESPAWSPVALPRLETVAEPASWGRVKRRDP